MSRLRSVSGPRSSRPLDVQRPVRGGPSADGDQESVRTGVRVGGDLAGSGTGRKINEARPAVQGDALGRQLCTTATEYDNSLAVTRRRQREFGV